MIVGIKMKNHLQDAVNQITTIDGVSGASTQHSILNTTGFSANSSLLNCTPGHWGGLGALSTLYYPQNVVVAVDMEINFVENGFVLKHAGKTYVANNLGNLFKVLEKLIEEKVTEAKAKEKKK